MELGIILLVVGIPLLWVTLFELKKRKIDFGIIKKINRDKFLKNILDKFKKQKIDFGVIKKINRDFLYKFKKEKRQIDATDTDATDDAYWYGDNNDNPEVDIISILKEVNDDFSKHPYIDKFEINNNNNNNIKYIFENGDSLELINKLSRNELSYYNTKNNHTNNIMLTEPQAINILKTIKFLTENTKHRINQKDDTKQSTTTLNGVTFTQDVLDDVKHKYDKGNNRSTDEIDFDNLTTLHEIKKKQLDSLPENDLEYSLRHKEIRIILKRLDILSKKLNK